jgi:hypothetical protein
MKWLKICTLLLIVLAAIRAGSWGLEWVLGKFTPIRAGAIYIAANLAAFGLFAFYLWWDLLPGEPIDPAALIFGLIVFAACCAGDFFWNPWKLGKEDAARRVKSQG